MNDLIDKIFERGVAVFAFTIGAFHLLNVSGIFVLSTRDIRLFHLLMIFYTIQISVLLV